MHTCVRTCEAELEVQVWTLPALEPVKVFSLTSCLGFPWGWQGEPSKLPLLQRMCSLGWDGRMVLSGPCNEVVTLTLLSGTHCTTGLRCTGTQMQMHHWKLNPQD